MPEPMPPTPPSGPAADTKEAWQTYAAQLAQQEQGHTQAAPVAPTPGVTRDAIGREISDLLGEMHKEEYRDVQDPLQQRRRERYRQLIDERGILDAQPPTAPVVADPAAALPFEVPDAMKADPVALELVTGAHTAGTALGMPAAEIQQLVSYKPAPVPAAQLQAALGDGAEDALDAAALALERFPANVQAYMHRVGLSTDPAVVKRLAALGKPLLEAEWAINRMRMDPKHAINRPQDPAEYTKALAEFHRLQQIVYGVEFQTGHVRR